MPTPYAVGISHSYQPYAKELWDSARFGFSAGSLAPAAPANYPFAFGLPVADDGVLVSVGGYGGRNFSSPEEQARIFETTPVQVAAGHQVVTFRGMHEHFLGTQGITNLDGRPLVITCWGGALHKCEIALSLMPSLMPPKVQERLRPEFRRSDSAGPMVKVEFAAAKFDEWPAIYREALCFVSAMVDQMHDLPFPSKDERLCRQVRSAIKRELERKTAALSRASPGGDGASPSP